MKCKKQIPAIITLMAILPLIWGCIVPNPGHIDGAYPPPEIVNHGGDLVHVDTDIRRIVVFFDHEMDPSTFDWGVGVVMEERIFNYKGERILTNIYGGLETGDDPSTPEIEKSISEIFDPPLTTEGVGAFTNGFQETINPNDRLTLFYTSDFELKEGAMYIYHVDPGFVSDVAGTSQATRVNIIFRVRIEDGSIPYLKQIYPPDEAGIGLTTTGGDPVPPFPPHGTVHVVFTEEFHNMRLLLEAENDQPLPDIYDIHFAEKYGPGPEVESWMRFGGEGLSLNTNYTLEIISEPPNLLEILDDTGDDADTGNGRPDTLDALLYPATQDLSGVPLGSGTVENLIEINGQYYHEYSNPEKSESFSSIFRTARVIIDQPLSDTLVTSASGIVSGRYVHSDQNPDVNVTSVEIFVDDISQGLATLSDGDFSLNVSTAGLSEGIHIVKAIGTSTDGAAGWDEIPVKIDFQPPDPPLNVFTIPGLHGAGLSWDANPNHDFVVEYVIERSTSSSGPYTRLSTPYLEGNLYYIDGFGLLVDGTTYYYRIIALDEDGTESIPSTPVEVTPSQWLWTIPVNDEHLHDNSLNIGFNTKHEFSLADPDLGYGSYDSGMVFLSAGNCLSSLSWDALEPGGSSVDAEPGGEKTIEYRTCEITEGSPSDWLEAWDERELIQLNTSTNQPTNGLPWLLSDSVRDVFYYDASAETVVNPSDDFSGDSIDTERWTDLSEITNQEYGKLYFELTPDSDEEATLKSNYRLEGDFDVQVDFAINEFPSSATEWIAAELGVEFYDGASLEKSISIGRSLDAGGGKYRIWDAGSDTEISSISTIHRFGKLRVKKSGATLEFYYFDAPNWINLDSVTLANSVWEGILFIRLANHTNEPILETVDVEWDNYRLNAGATVGYTGSPEPWTDSSLARTSSWYLEYERMGDDFSGTEINPLFWSVSGDPDISMTIRPGLDVLRVQAHSGITYENAKRATAEGHYRIEGDFDIQVDLINWYYSGTHESGINFGLVFSWGPEGSNTAFIRRDGQGKYVDIFVNNGDENKVSVDVDDSPPGKVRYRLDGNILTSYYWNAALGEWAKIKQRDIGGIINSQTNFRAYPAIEWYTVRNFERGWVDLDDMIIAHGKVVFVDGAPAPVEISHRSRQAFPSKSYLVATDQEVAIIDPEYSEVWMRFERGNMLGNYVPSAIFMQNGLLKEGSSDGLGSANGPLVNIDFLADQAHRLNTSSGEEILSPIGYRNALSKEISASYPSLVSEGINDIDQISSAGGVSWSAVGTDGGITLIKDETTGYNCAQATPVEKIIFDPDADRMFWTSGTQVYLTKDVFLIGSDFTFDANLDIGSLITSLAIKGDNLFVGTNAGVKVVDAVSMTEDSVLTARIESILPLDFDRMVVSDEGRRILIAVVNDSDSSSISFMVDAYTGGLIWEVSSGISADVIDMASENEGSILGSGANGAMVSGPLIVPWREATSGETLSGTGRYLQIRASLRADGTDYPTLRAIYNHMKIDTEPPNPPIALEYPEITNQSSVTILGTKDSGVSVWINGVEAVPADLKQSWVALISLSPGTNTLSLTSKDGNGNESTSTTIEIIYDNIPPVLSVDYPFQDDVNDGHINDVVNIYSLLVTGSATDTGCEAAECHVNVRIASVPAEVAGDGTFNGYQLLQYGENEIQVEVTDNAGNITSQAFTVIRVEQNLNPCSGSTTAINVYEATNWYPENNNIQVTCDLQFQTSLTVHPGTTVEFGSGKKMGFYSAHFVADGAGDMITFKGIGENTIWNGILIDPGNKDRDMILKNVKFTNAAGYYSIIYLPDASSPTEFIIDNVTLENSKGFKITNTTNPNNIIKNSDLKDSLNTSIYCPDSSIFSVDNNQLRYLNLGSSSLQKVDISNNTFYGNGGTPNVFMYAPPYAALTMQGSVRGNEFINAGYINIYARTFPIGYAGTFFYDPNVTYRIRETSTGGTVLQFNDTSSSLTIEPGVTIEFEQDTKLTLVNTYFTAIGETDRITLKGVDSNTTWKGIDIGRSKGVSILKNIDIENANNGSGSIYYNPDASTSGQLLIDDVDVANSIGFYINCNNNQCLVENCNLTDVVSWSIRAPSGNEFTVEGNDLKYVSGDHDSGSKIHVNNNRFHEGYNDVFLKVSPYVVATMQGNTFEHSGAGGYIYIYPVSFTSGGDLWDLPGVIAYRVVSYDTDNMSMKSNGGSFTIHPGVDLFFDSKTGLEIGDGNFTAEGDVATRDIEFKNWNTGESWLGIKVGQKANTVLIKNSKILNPNQTSESYPSIHFNGHDSDNYFNATVENNIIQSGTLGIRIENNVADNQIVQIKYNDLSQTGPTSVKSQIGTGGARPFSLIGNTLRNLYISYGSSTEKMMSIIKDNTFVNCSGAIITAPFNSVVTMAGNTFDSSCSTGHIRILGGDLNADWSTHYDGRLFSDPKISHYRFNRRPTNNGIFSVRQGHSLTIDPGVVLKFDPGVSLNMDHARLLAEGTIDRPIIFTSNSTNPAPGDWDGITLNKGINQEQDSFKYCIVEYAGGVSGRSVINVGDFESYTSPVIHKCILRHISGDHAIGLDECNQSGHFDNTKITNSLIYDNSGYGVCLGTRGTGDEPEIRHNTIEGGVRVSSNALDRLKAKIIGNRFINYNGDRHIRITLPIFQKGFIGNRFYGTDDSSMLEIYGDQYNQSLYFKNYGVKYRILDDHLKAYAGTGESATYVNQSGSTVTIEPGVEMQFLPNKGFYLYRNYDNIKFLQVTLNAEGTLEKPILLTNYPGSGNWGGVFFGPTQFYADRSILKHVKIENAGADTGSSFFPPAALVIRGDNPLIENLIIDNSNSKGIYYSRCVASNYASYGYSCDPLPEIKYASLTNNSLEVALETEENVWIQTSPPAYIEYEMGGQLDAAMFYWDNPNGPIQDSAGGISGSANYNPWFAENPNAPAYNQSPIKFIDASISPPDFSPSSAATEYQSTTISANINITGNITVTIKDSGGSITIKTFSSVGVNEASFTWDGTDELGDPVSAGEYQVYFEATDSLNLAASLRGFIVIDEAAPIAKITSPIEEEIIDETSGNIEIHGYASLADPASGTATYTIWYAHESTPDKWHRIHDGTGNVEDQLLYNWNFGAGPLVAGYHFIRLRVESPSGKRAEDRIKVYIGDQIIISDVSVSSRCLKPTSPPVRIEFNASRPAHGTVEIFKLVMEYGEIIEIPFLSIPFSSGNYSVELPYSSLAKGGYVFTILAEADDNPSIKGSYRNFSSTGAGDLNEKVSGLGASFGPSYLAPPNKFVELNYFLPNPVIISINYISLDPVFFTEPHLQEIVVMSFRCAGRNTEYFEIIPSGGDSCVNIFMGSGFWCRNVDPDTYHPPDPEWMGPGEGPCPEKMEELCYGSQAEICPEVKNKILMAGVELPPDSIVVPDNKFMALNPMEFDNRKLLPVFQEAASIRFVIQPGQEYQVLVYDIDGVIIFDSERVIPPEYGLQTFIWNGRGNVWGESRVNDNRGVYAIVLRVYNIGENNPVWQEQRMVHVSY